MNPSDKPSSPVDIGPALPSVAGLEMRADDYLRENAHFYAFKAKQKKIALIKIEAINKSASAVQLLLNNAQLNAGEQNHRIEPPEAILRKVSEFTWDFLIYVVLDFQPWLAAVDLFFLLFGPIYNRRLKKQLRLLSDGELVLQSGERKEAIVAFRPVRFHGGQLRLHYRSENQLHELQCDVSRNPRLSNPRDSQ